jgi:hypothetical protein
MSLPGFEAHEDAHACWIESLRREGTSHLQGSFDEGGEAAATRGKAVPDSTAGAIRHSSHAAPADLLIELGITKMRSGNIRAGQGSRVARCCTAKGDES